MPAEYGNQEIEPHVLDRANISNVPPRMTNNGTNYGYCTDDIAITRGDFLMTSSQMFNQISCTPNTGNVGNYYSWTTSLAINSIEHDSSYYTPNFVAPNSICPHGWQLPTGNNKDSTNHFTILLNSYSTTSSSALRASPASFINSGRWRYSTGAEENIGIQGNYWSKTFSSEAGNQAFGLFISSPPMVSPVVRGFGISIRCLAR